MCRVLSPRLLLGTTRGRTCPGTTSCVCLNVLRSAKKLTETGRKVFQTMTSLVSVKISRNEVVGALRDSALSVLCGETSVLRKTMHTVSNQITCIVVKRGRVTRGSVACRSVRYVDAVLHSYSSVRLNFAVCRRRRGK